MPPRFDLPTIFRGQKDPHPNHCPVCCGIGVQFAVEYASHLPVQYFGPHFDIPNIVAHVRSTERTTPVAARLLVLEEIQSDWNQELRAAIQEARMRRPIDDAAGDVFDWDDDLLLPPFNPYLNHWLEAALRMMLLLAASRGFSGIAWLPGGLHAERFPWANADGLKAFYDRIVPAAVAKLVKSWGAQLDEAQFPALSRQFEVRRLAGNKKWKVVHRESGRVGDEEFFDQDAAEAFRRSKEFPVLEKITAVYLSDAMRVDIRQHGLPYLGAVGSRQVARASTAKRARRGEAECDQMAIQGQQQANALCNGRSACSGSYGFWCAWSARSMPQDARR